MVEATTNCEPDLSLVVASTYTGENTWAAMSEEEREAHVQEILDKAAAWTPFTNRTD